MQSPRSPSPSVLSGPTTFSSITDPTLHRRGWRSTLARDDPVAHPRQLPPRFRGRLRYELLSEANAIYYASQDRASSHASTLAVLSASPTRSNAAHAGTDDIDDSDNSDSARRANVDELKWFEHRWLNKHGKNSQLKEFRAKMVLMRRWFESLDTDGSGEVGLNELEDPLVSVGLARSRDDVQKLIDEVGKDGRGEVTFDEFLHLMYPKKVKRQRKRAPLHEPKARTSVDERVLDAHTIGVTPSAKVNTTRPSSPLSSPRAPTSPSSGFTSSPRRSARQVPCSSSNSDKNVGKPKVNPVVKLFEDLQSGKLGDLAIPFPVLITAYRRRMLLNAHMAEDPTARSLGTSVLQALESSRREVVSTSDHRRRSSVSVTGAVAQCQHPLSSTPPSRRTSMMMTTAPNIVIQASSTPRDAIESRPRNRSLGLGMS